MPGISSLINAGGRVFGSRSHRRELRAYLRFVAARRRWQIAAREVFRTITARQAGELPPGLSLPGPTQNVEPTTPFDFPLGSAPDLEPGHNEQLEIDLAGTTLADLSSLWSHTFKDPEKMFAAHRFGWCLKPLAGGLSAPSLLTLGHLAVEWIRVHPFGPESAGWDSYSISERIVNWIYLAARLNELHTPESAAIHRALAQSIDIHAGVLMERLELRGTSTNNHLLNNARALYLAGVFLGRGSLQELGREILRYGLREMFTPSGFLREGSSHYHILVCRSYLEVFWYALKRGDLSFVDQLRDGVAAQVKCAAFLLGHSSLPLIGDVSPDFPPDFHKGVPAVGNAMLGGKDPIRTPDDSGWHSLFGIRPDKSSPSHPRKTRDVQIFDDAGYYSVDWGPVKMTLYVNPLGYVPAWSHGHADLGGFVLEWDGHPLLVDCGRSTYEANAFGRYGRSVRSHNAIAIDRHEPCVVHAHNGFVPPMSVDYCGRPPVVSVVDRGDMIRLSVHYFGFERLQDGLTISRVFEVTRDRVKINDQIDGNGQHLVETFFHFHPAIELAARDDNCLQLTVGDTRLALSSAGNHSPGLDIFRGREGAEPAGWFSPRYGVLLPSVTLRYSQRTALPARNSYTIEPN
jgi:heparinase II/III-like protein